MSDSLVVKPTQTINVGQVTITNGTSAQIVAANTNRKSLKVILTSGQGSKEVYFGTSSGVTGSNGFPFAADNWDAGLGSTSPMTLNWQSAVYAHNSYSSPLIVAYIEELLV